MKGVQDVGLWHHRPRLASRVLGWFGLGKSTSVKVSERLMFGLNVKKTVALSH